MHASPNSPAGPPDLLTFDAWLADSQGPDWSGRNAACRWNLLAETRIPEVMAEFRALLGEVHETECTTATTRSAAALASLGKMVEQTRGTDSRWLGHLRLEAADTVPASTCTHVSVRELRRYARLGRITPGRPPRRIRLERPLKAESNGKLHTRFIWITFATAESPLPDEPAAVMRELGLAWYDPGDHIYRIVLTVDPNRLLVPTCLDAGINEAWAPPPAGSAWGMTRHLETGLACRPELLTEASDHVGAKLVAELVSPPGVWRTVGEVVCDFLCNRGGHGP